MGQYTFPHHQIAEALQEFLTSEERNPDGTRVTRRVIAEDQIPRSMTTPATDIAMIVDPALWTRSTEAQLVSPDYFAELEDDAEAWREHCKPRIDDDMKPGYRPYQHAPTAREDRLLPTEPMHEPLARIFYGKKVEELTEEEKRRVEHGALEVLLRTTFDPDTQGAVPILMLSNDDDQPQPRMFWQLAFVTPVPGLFVRATHHPLFVEEWHLVTGSGLYLRGGWFGRDAAVAAAEAIGRTFPNVDWMRVNHLPAAALTALTVLLTRHSQAGVREDKPEPEPFLEPVPAPEEPPGDGPDPTEATSPAAGPATATTEAGTETEQ